MDESILNVEGAMEFLGVSEKTLIKLLREEHIPARKIGREWRFSKEALTHWISSGDSSNYTNTNEKYQCSEDEVGNTEALIEAACSKLYKLKASKKLEDILDLEKKVSIPKDAKLRVSYKQQRDIEKVEFKIYWLSEDNKVEEE